MAPGYCTEYIHVYLAEELTESRLRADEDELIEVVPLTLSEALAAIAAGQIQDAKSQVGLLMYAARHAPAGHRPATAPLPGSATLAEPRPIAHRATSEAAGRTVAAG
ncbi:MAG: hypothetical protein C4290_14590 [Chloroflexota bacterium]